MPDEKPKSEALKTSPAVQLAGFLARYTPEVASLASEVLARMRRRMPHSLELIYDNYNALAIGFGPTERASDAICSIAVFPRWVSLFFLQAKGLRDPDKVLKGSGKQARHIVLADASDLDDSRIDALMEEALARASEDSLPKVPHRQIVKSISANQRPRRPLESGGAAAQLRRSPKANAGATRKPTIKSGRKRRAGD